MNTFSDNSHGTDYLVCLTGDLPYPVTPVVAESRARSHFDIGLAGPIELDSPGSVKQEQKGIPKAEAMPRAIDNTSNLTSTPSPDNSAPSTPSSSFSDKENTASRSANSRGSEKRRQDERRSNMDSSANKRRKTSDNNLGMPASQAAHKRQLSEVNDTQYYDPDQDPEERRKVRKGLKDLATLLNGWITPLELLFRE